MPDCAAANSAGRQEVCYVMSGFYAESLSNTMSVKDMTHVRLLLLRWAWAA